MATVLVVEDEPAIASMMVAILRRMHLDAEVIFTCAEAVRRVDTVAYAAIVLDMMLPDCLGFEVINHIKNVRPELLKRVIVITASFVHLQKLDAASLGGTLLKPFDIEEMASLIRVATNS